MSGLPFGKFFWSDYASDPALKICSLAAQGLWMRMLCVAAEHDPVGYVAINGEGLDAAGISSLAGTSVDQAEPLLAELARRGVFSRDRRGWIYSRRMVRDAKKARNARENGKKGGNPSLRQQKENPPQDKPAVKAEDKPHIPETRVQKGSEDKSSGGKPPALIEDVWGLGISLLAESGIEEKAARSLIGKWKKSRGEGEVISAFWECRRQEIAQPVEWLTMRLKAARYVSASGYEYRGDVDSVIREAERRSDWSVYWQAKGDRDGRAAEPQKAAVR